MKRIIDILLVILVTALMLVPILIVAILVCITSEGPTLFWSERIGSNNVIFKMPKFRTMREETPSVASHLLKNPSQWLTPVGNFLRKTSLDELPQLWSIIRGDMSFVGPRPALFNQYDLIEMRTELGIHRLKPGLTGLAQVNGRDEISINLKVFYDLEYMKRQSLFLDIKILSKTLIKITKFEGVTH